MIASMSCFGTAGSDRSPLTAKAAPSSAQTASADACSIPWMMTSAPQAIALRAVALPIPETDPVIKTGPLIRICMHLFANQAQQTLEVAACRLEG